MQAQDLGYTERATAKYPAQRRAAVPKERVRKDERVMIVVMAAHATEAQIKDVETRILDWGYGVHPIYGAERTVIGAVGVPEADKGRYMESLESLPYVEQVL